MHYSAAISQRRSSDHDSDKVKVIDNTYIESAIFNMFKIDILNYIKIKAILAKEFHIQPSEIDSMPAWEYELFTKEINNAVKEENERNKQEMDKSGVGDAKKMVDPKNAKRYQSSSMPKMPSMPSMGSFKIPKM